MPHPRSTLAPCHGPVVFLSKGSRRRALAWSVAAAKEDQQRSHGRRGCRGGAKTPARQAHASVLLRRGSPRAPDDGTLARAVDVPWSCHGTEFGRSDGGPVRTTVGLPRNDGIYGGRGRWKQDDESAIIGQQETSKRVVE